MHKTIKINADIVCDWMIIILLNGDAFRAGFNFILSRFGATALSPLCVNVLMLFPLVLLLVSNEGGIAAKRMLPFILVLSGAAFYFILTLLIHPNYEQYIIRDDYLDVWYSVFRPDTGAIWMFLAFSMVRDPKRMITDLRIAAYIMLLFGVYQTVTHNNEWVTYNYAGQLVTQNYNLNFGYRLVFSCIILLNSFLENRKHWIDLVAAVGVGMLALSQGSRGAFMCLAIYIVLYILTELQHIRLSRRLLLCTMLVALAGLLMTNLPRILIWLQQKFSGYGGNSRLIQMFLSGDLNSDSGRTKIYEISWASIKEQGFFGNGAYGSRWIISPRFYWGYPHNIYLELVMEIGLVPGTVLFLYLVYKIVRSLRSQDPVVVDGMCMLTAISSKLVISDSFWTYGYFWATLGFMYAIGRIKKEQTVPRTIRDVVS